MSLLELEQVEKAYGRGASRQVVLSDVTLEIEAGETVAIWGMRRSGRSTLLRVAAGIEHPDTGVVRFAGRDLRDRRCEVLGGEIAFCRKNFRASEGDATLDHLTVGQLARGVTPALAARRARAALERAGAEACAARRPNELDCEECVRVAVARALALQPSVLLIDEPTLGVDLLARDGILTMLRSLADGGMAIVTSTGETTGLTGARALTLSEGELHGGPRRELATVVPIRRSA
jgi:predicted ABC-type transport system involved in lysophospholipase L1 biosynthesis ATPase subunit